MKKAGPVLFVLIALALCHMLNAQTTSDIFTRLETNKSGEGTVKIKQDADIRNLVNTHISQIQRLKGIRGYRISIYMGSGQEANKQADQVISRFLSKFEEVESHKKFEYPYFKVYVGDFRTKSEALWFMKKIENDYPDAFIREDIIEFPD